MTEFLGVPDVGLWDTVALCAAAVLTTFVGTVTGTAGGLLLLAIMTFFLPLTALMPVHTIVQLGSGSSRTFLMWRYVKKKLIVPFALGSAAGAIAGEHVFVTLPSATLQALLGAFILAVLWMPRLALGGPERPRFAAIGALTTFIGVFVSATGTFLSPFVAHASADRHVHVSTMSTLMAVTHAAKLIAYGFVGIAVGAYAPLIALMIAGTVLGNWTGRRALDRIPERMFRTVFQVLLCLLAVRLLVGALLESSPRDRFSGGLRNPPRYREPFLFAVGRRDASLRPVRPGLREFSCASRPGAREPSGPAPFSGGGARRNPANEIVKYCARPEPGAE